MSDLCKSRHHLPVMYCCITAWWRWTAPFGLPEAPFGESNGYVALEAFNMPIEVTAITHKRKPVFAQIISQVTPSESSVIKKVAYEPLFLAHLKTQLGVKGIRRVFMHERLTNLRPVIFLQFAAGTPRTEDRKSVV